MKRTPATPLPWFHTSETVDVTTEAGEFIATTLQPDTSVAVQSAIADNAGRLLASLGEVQS